MSGKRINWVGQRPRARLTLTNNGAACALQRHCSIALGQIDPPQGLAYNGCCITQQQRTQRSYPQQTSPDAVGSLLVQRLLVKGPLVTAL